MIGLPKGSVLLIPYTEEWARLFEQAAEELRSAAGEHILAIEHIGSTSVPGLAAKPVIDIAIAVREISDVEKCVPELERIGYEYRGEHGIPMRHFFCSGEPRTHHLHVVEITSDHWRVHLLFRDHLRRNEQARHAYQALKEDLAKKYPHDRVAYTDGKSEFIQSALKQAGGSGIDG